MSHAERKRLADLAAALDAAHVKTNLRLEGGPNRGNYALAYGFLEGVLIECADQLRRLAA